MSQKNMKKILKNVKNYAERNGAIFKKIRPYKKKRTRKNRSRTAIFFQKKVLTLM